jgi:hypothetical protein
MLAIEKAVENAYGSWSDAERRSIWYDTDTGMTADDDDALCDTSFNGIGYSLQIERLDELTNMTPFGSPLGRLYARTH